MTEQPLPDKTPSPPAPSPISWVLKMLFWALIGAALGVLWAFFHYGSEGWREPVVVLAIAFGLAGAFLSLVVGKGCRT
jgi:RsiW-degrading membrane proteinase PrsW (M82 family)